MKIDGTDGARQLPMLVDPLTVTSPARRERGAQILAADGKARTITRTYPLFAPPGSPGLLPLRALVELSDEDGAFRALITAIHITASRSGEAVNLRQTLTLERQYREAA